jgi:membrane protein DedA with SNARE-associated domain
MKWKVGLWTFVVAFVGYSLGANGAVENISHELIGTAAGGTLGFLIGYGLQRYDERRSKTSKPSR